VCGLAGSGYAVHADELKSGSKEVSGLVSECKRIADLITAAASALAGAVGNPAVESAALGMGASALKQMSRLQGTAGTTGGSPSSPATP
jgi:hypothetical protein